MTAGIVGGVDGPGGLEGTVERVVPQTMAFAMVDGTGLTPRAQHTATLLTDGRLLIAGGTTLSERAAESAEVFDFRSGHRLDTDSRLHGGRQSHNARLLADGSIYISAGVDHSVSRSVMAKSSILPEICFALPSRRLRLREH